MKEVKKDIKKISSMKEALDSIKSSRRSSVEVVNKDRMGLRDIFWSYPSFFSNIFRKTAPLSFILIFSLIGLGVFSFLRSDIFAEVFDTKSNDTFVEGTVGAISTLNPLFTSQNPVDKDIQSLVFEKFVEVDSKGDPQKSIAQNWAVASDGKTYDFKISLDHRWQDGKLLTMEDIIFTFETAKMLSTDYGYDTVGSALSNVTLTKISDDTVRFTLTESNSTFFEAVSVYIVPKHILEDISLYELPFNSFAKYPIGSGPYKVYRSEPNVVYLEASNYYWVTPKIETFVYRLYSDYESLEAAFRNKVLDAASGVDGGSMSFSDEYSEYTKYEFPLYTRLRMIFYNIRKEKLESEKIRMALDYLTDKDELLEDSSISGESLYGPISKMSWAYSEKEISKYAYDPKKASELLKGLGYTKDETTGFYQSSDNKILSFTLSYYDNSINNRLVNSLRDLWKEEGIILILEPLSYTQLTQEIVATRDFELLLYEVETTIDPDQYNLWHSLKTNYPDLNLSGYEYERVDILLEEGRKSVQKSVRKEKYRLFQKYLTADAPVLFLYNPNYTYIVNKDTYVSEFSDIAYPSDRFKDIVTWSK